MTIKFIDDRNDKEYAIEIPADDLPYLSEVIARSIADTQEKRGLGINQLPIIEVKAVGTSVLQGAEDHPITALSLEFGLPGCGLHFWFSEDLLVALRSQIDDRLTEIGKHRRPQH